MKRGKTTFRSEWGTLEVAYAMMLDQKGEGLVQTSRRRLMISPTVQMSVKQSGTCSGLCRRIDTTAGAETDAGDGAIAG